MTDTTTISNPAGLEVGNRPWRVQKTSAVLEAERERATERTVAVIWALVFFNVIEVTSKKSILPLPHTADRILTQGALVPALLLAYMINKRLTVRPNPFLAVTSVLTLGALACSVAFASFHTDLRALRFIALVLVLWLLTPWWGRDDFLIARVHLRCLEVLLGSVLLGLLVAPGHALIHGRLSGAIWPIASTQVGHYAAITAGIAGVMFLAGRLGRRRAAFIFVVAVAMLLLTHTRTALVAMLIGLVVASLSLLAWNRRARRALLAFAVIVVVVGGLFRPQIESWASRGESSTELSTLTGRTYVWHALETAPRTETQILFGFGLSTASFNGLPIDSSWLSLYEALGLFGVIMAGLSVLVLILLLAVRPRGPGRAIAIFLITYCLIASYTETGLGLPSPYLLDLSVAAAMLAPRVATRLSPLGANTSAAVASGRRSATRVRRAAA